MFKYSCSVQQSIFLELNKIFEVMIRSPWQAWNLKIYISLQRTFFLFVFREAFFVERFLSKSTHSVFMVRRILRERTRYWHNSGRARYKYGFLIKNTWIHQRLNHFCKIILNSIKDVHEMNEYNQKKLVAFESFFIPEFWEERGALAARSWVLFLF